jgi:[acyl-carrier-protein] S-malonyltransferase
MLEAGATEFTECGPGKALQGMVGKIAAGREGIIVKGI